MGNRPITFEARLLGCLALVAAALGPSACRDSTVTDRPERRLRQVRVIESKGRFLVTPRWSPKGDKLLFSGRGGRGLVIYDISRQTFSLAHPVYRGAARFSAEGKLLTRNAAGPGGKEILYEDPSILVVMEAYRGRLTAEEKQGRPRLLAEGAWGAKVSPDGRLVAYCLGHLKTSQLFVKTLSGKLLYQGPGAQPDWFPGGGSLVYTIPETDPEPRGGGRLKGADLHILDLPSGKRHRLTRSPGITEMEPAFSPQGNHLAYVDWRSGTSIVAVMENPGGGR